MNYLTFSVQCFVSDTVSSYFGEISHPADIDDHHATGALIMRFKYLLCRMLCVTTACLSGGFAASLIQAAELLTIRAGTGRADITNREAGPVNDTLYAKALVLDDGSKRAVIITIDAVAIAQIGSIRNTYLAEVRKRLAEECQISPDQVMINASHCHGIVCADIEDRTVKAVKSAIAALEPVKIGVGKGFENRVSENRRMKLKNGREADVRHAYSLPFDDKVAEAGPIDPEIGILKLDRLNGSTLAVLYNFAVHPIQGVPDGSNTADLSGFASRAIEESLGKNATALFIQGCAGDINPVRYKDVHNPRDAEQPGSLLGLSVLKALAGIKTREVPSYRMVRESLLLPRSNLKPTIESLENQRDSEVNKLAGTSLNFKTYMQLAAKYNVSPEFPSADAATYMHQNSIGRNHLESHDKSNLKNMADYLRNIETMENLTRIQTNIALLKMHQGQNEAAGFNPLEVEMVGLRIDDFLMVTFPGELTVRIGLGLKKNSPVKNTFIAGYTNGYIYYAPTEEQLKNVGWAQEDSDCVLAPGWQNLFEQKARKMIDLLK